MIETDVTKTNMYKIMNYDNMCAELATIRAENERLRSIIHRAKVQVPASVWTWHEDANEALK